MILGRGKDRARILVVFGTRPEAIKLAPLIGELRKLKRCEVMICVTAQHRQMLDQVLTLFEIEPDVDLDLMREDQSLAQLTAETLTSMRSTLQELEPAMVIVQGDTTTTFATSLAAFYERIPVAHVEAGLRTGNFAAPWPEEMNRVVTTLLSEIHFAPTPLARKNLLRDGVPKDRVFVTGNTVVDALLAIEEKLSSGGSLRVETEAMFSFLDPLKRLLLVTGHRRESFGSGLESVCRALVDVVERNEDVEIVYPVHLNPNVQKPVNEILGDHKNIHLMDPVEYVALVYLLKRSYFVLTDSGGIQEEAPTFGKPVLVLREATERPEAVKAGTAKLVGTDRSRIVREAEKLLRDPDHYGRMSRAGNPFGDGKASGRIAKILKGHI
jgi:UDP-N-acetylglucosamine 2-epimerase (non-hydrolysing)